MFMLYLKIVTVKIHAVVLAAVFKICYFYFVEKIRGKKQLFCKADLIHRARVSRTARACILRPA